MPKAWASPRCDEYLEETIKDIHAAVEEKLTSWELSHSIVSSQLLQMFKK